MNGSKTVQNRLRNFNIPNNLIWGGAVGSIFVVIVVLIVISMRSSEQPNAFLARWKNALESGEPKKYEALWVPSARRKYAQVYKNTVRHLNANGIVKFEVNLRDTAIAPRRVPRYPNRLRIEGIPVIVHLPGESQEQFRNLLIEKKGILQKRWKIINDEVVGGELTTVPRKSESEVQPDAASPPHSPVIPFVTTWEKTLESKDSEKYENLWDKSARKKRKAEFQRASSMISSSAVVDMTQATYVAIPRRKNRHIVDNIRVTLYDGDTAIETHSRRLTIEKRGFFFRKWKLINDEIRDAISPAESVTASAQSGTPESGEGAGDTFDDNAPLDTQLKVRQVLGKWQAAWEGKDINTYMSLYAERAQITRVTVRGGGKGTPTYLTKSQLQEKMKKLNRLYADIQVTISNLQINGDSAVADVKFLQKFTGTPASGTRPAYSDYGTKKLNLMVDPADGHWRIYAESWRFYEDVPDFQKM